MRQTGARRMRMRTFPRALHGGIVNLSLPLDA